MSSFKSDNHPLQYSPVCFVQEIESLCTRLNDNTVQIDDLLMKALSVIRKYKGMGLSCQEAYNLIEPIFRHCPNDSPQKEFIGDILDCICGYVGNKEYRIY